MTQEQVDPAQVLNDAELTALREQHYAHRLQELGPSVSVREYKLSEQTFVVGILYPKNPELSSLYYAKGYGTATESELKARVRQKAYEGETGNTVEIKLM